MKVHTAQLAGRDNNQDHIFVTDSAVTLPDGASAFGPVDVDLDFTPKSSALQLSRSSIHIPLQYRHGHEYLVNLRAKYRFAVDAAKR